MIATQSATPHVCCTQHEQMQHSIFSTIVLASRWKKETHKSSWDFIMRSPNMCATTGTSIASETVTTSPREAAQEILFFLEEYSEPKYLFIHSSNRMEYISSTSGTHWSRGVLSRHCIWACQSVNVLIWMQCTVCISDIWTIHSHIKFHQNSTSLVNMQEINECYIQALSKGVHTTLNV